MPPPGFLPTTPPSRNARGSQVSAIRSSGIFSAGMLPLLSTVPLAITAIRVTNVRFDGFDAQDILGALQPHLAASPGAACASGIPEPSHVLGALGLTETQSKASIRFSFGRFTTDGDIEAAARFVLEALHTLSVEPVKIPV